MDSDGRAERGDRGLDGVCDLPRQPSAVGVAQADQIDPGVIDRLDAGDREFGIGEVAVEEMLGVENHFVNVLFEIGDGVVENLEIGRQRNPQRLAHVQVPGLADDGRDGRIRLQHQLQVAVGRGAEYRRGESNRRLRSSRAAA